MLKGISQGGESCSWLLCAVLSVFWASRCSLQSIKKHFSRQISGCLARSLHVRQSELQCEADPSPLSIPFPPPRLLIIQVVSAVFDTAPQCSPPHSRNEEKLLPRPRTSFQKLRMSKTMNRAVHFIVPLIMRPDNLHPKSFEWFLFIITHWSCLCLVVSSTNHQRSVQNNAKSPCGVPVKSLSMNFYIIPKRFLWEIRTGIFLLICNHYDPHLGRPALANALLLFHSHSQ